MNKKLLLLAGCLGCTATLSAEGFVFPTDDVTYKHYSMGAYVEPNGEELNWDSGYYITFAYANNSNDVWVSNLFPQFFVDGTATKDGYTHDMMTWVHGTLNETKNRITFTVEKVFHFYDNDRNTDYDLYVQGVRAENETEFAMSSFDFIVKENGDIQIDDDTYNPSIYVCLLEHDAEGNVPVGSNGISVADYALGYEFTLLREDQTHYPELPNGGTTETYNYETTAWNGESNSQEVKITSAGNDLYLTGLTTLKSMFTGELLFPDLVVKGTMAADKASFSIASNQFYGIENYFGVYYITFFSGLEYNEATEVYDPLDEVKFVNAGEGVWKLEEDTNIGCMTLEGTLYELVAEASLRSKSGTQIRGIEEERRHNNTRYDLYGRAQNKGHKGFGIVNKRTFLVK